MVLTDFLSPFLPLECRIHWQLLVGARGHFVPPAFECGFPAGTRQSKEQIAGLPAKAFRTSKLLRGKVG